MQEISGLGAEFVCTVRDSTNDSLTINGKFLHMSHNFEASGEYGGKPVKMIGDWTTSVVNGQTSTVYQIRILIEGKEVTVFNF